MAQKPVQTARAEVQGKRLVDHDVLRGLKQRQDQRRRLLPRNRFAKRFRQQSTLRLKLFRRPDESRRGRKPERPRDFARLLEES